MIAYIRGKITFIGPRYVILENNNIGYKVNVTDDALHELSSGQDTLLWTHDAVREDSHELYGFAVEDERNLFELLLTVSGIGPKTALNILSLVSAKALIGAIHSGSTAHLVKVSGIGRKTAEKIVMELRDRIAEFGNGDNVDMNNDSDAIEALKALGYNTDEAREAIKKLNKDIADTGDKIKAALKFLSR